MERAKASILNAVPYPVDKCEPVSQLIRGCPPHGRLLVDLFLAAPNLSPVGGETRSHWLSGRGRLSILSQFGDGE